MNKRVLTYGAVLGVFALALTAILRILDVVSLQEATESLGKTLSVIIVSSVALVLMVTIVNLNKRQ
jgi:hypothetical protein